ncbi:MAG: histidine--tRNA ligase, partial [Dehalococcoidia bacterium]|nr:histidine--tRNA ligase [Dehalococcoidia bacterium]
DTDIVEKEMYLFKDRGGKEMSLKPEGTASVCRAYLEHGMANLPQPVRLYYLSPVFRYERPQAGRLRQHHQLGAEALGEVDPVLDAEIIDLAWRFYLSLGLRGLSIQVNSLGCRQCRPAYRQALVAYFASRLGEMCPDCRSRFDRNPLRLLDCKHADCIAVGDAAPRSTDYLCPECSRHFDSVAGYLNLWELSYNLNHRLVRGLDYYTRTVFEIQPLEEGSQSTIGGGGRYDDLMGEMGGRPTPGVGFATGLERIVRNLQRQGAALPAASGPRIYVCYLEEAREEAFRLLAELRRGGVEAVAAVGGRSLKSQLRQADAQGMNRAIILGGDELRSGILMVRNMRNSQQEPVPRGRLVAFLRGLSG